MIHKHRSIASIFEVIVAQPREHVKVSQLQRVTLADTQHSFANVYGRILGNGMHWLIQNF